MDWMSADSALPHLAIELLDPNPAQLAHVRDKATRAPRRPDWRWLLTCDI